MKKKLQTIASKLLRKPHHGMRIQFWGVRGTLPVTGRHSIRYGGNTNCISLRFGNEFLIFDAGTGIKALSNDLIKKNKFPLSAKIFITHPHYDHINGIPFFRPLYMPGNRFEIYGTNHAGFNIETLISGQMDSVYFPVTMKEFGSTFTFHNLKEETFQIGELEVRTILLNHPGKCMGYRIQHKNKSFCYITDNELYFENNPNYAAKTVDELIEFIHGADLVVMDTTWITDEEYLTKLSWGHSCVSRVIDVADRAKVKTLCLFHHDPDQMDEDIDAKLKKARMLLKQRHSTTQCIAAKEGEKIII
jgi:phosphoribosyl 1,2-cyclic phosphodiesterase